jgi:hypothetical protein
MARRTKDVASVNEKEDIRFIIDAIHTKSEIGVRFNDAFREKFGLILGHHQIVVLITILRFLSVLLMAQRSGCKWSTKGLL